MSSTAKIQSEPVPGTSYTFDDLMHPAAAMASDLSVHVKKIPEELKGRVSTMLETPRGRSQLLLATAALGFGVGILLCVWRSHA